MNKRTSKNFPKEISRPFQSVEPVPTLDNSVHIPACEPVQARNSDESTSVFSERSCSSNFSNICVGKENIHVASTFRTGEKNRVIVLHISKSAAPQT